ncbi:hypothetical protein HispidOSU_014718, partial [Sigmodon hispidus]
GKESKVALNKADQKHEKTVQKIENPNVIVANTDGPDGINNDKATGETGFRAPSLMGEPILKKDLDSPLIRSSHPIKSLYPVIHRDKGDDWPDPTSEANLEGEAARFEKKRYDPRRVQTLPALKPHLLAAQELSVLQWPPTPPPDTPPAYLPGVQRLLATKESLLGQVQSLREVLSLKRELEDLTRQIQTLQADLIKMASPPK